MLVLHSEVAYFNMLKLLSLLQVLPLHLVVLYYCTKWPLQNAISLTPTQHLAQQYYFVYLNFKAASKILVKGLYGWAMYIKISQLNRVLERCEKC